MTVKLYPPPPWILAGHGLMVFTTKLSSLAVESLPQAINTISILPGKTLSGFYIAEYSTPLSSVEKAPWYEWGDVWAYAKCMKRRGFYIREMAVDSPAACQGGIEMWGLNKMMANIRVVAEKGSGSAILHNDDAHIELKWKEYAFAIPKSNVTRFISSINDVPHRYQVKMKGKFSLCRVEVVKNTGSHFNSVQEGKYWGMRFRNADVVIEAAEAIGA